MNNTKKESLRGTGGVSHQNSNSMGNFTGHGGSKEGSGSLSSGVNIQGDYANSAAQRGLVHSNTMNAALKQNPSHSVNPSASQPKHSQSKEIFSAGARAGGASFSGTHHPYTKSQLISSGTKRHQFTKHTAGTMRSPNSNDVNKNSNSIDGGARPTQKQMLTAQRGGGAGPGQMGMSMVAATANNYGSNFSSSSQSQNSTNNKSNQNQNNMLNKKGSLTYRNKNNRNSQQQNHQSQYQQNFMQATNANAASRDAARQNPGSRGNRGAVSSRDRGYNESMNNQQAINVGKEPEFGSFPTAPQNIAQKAVNQYQNTYQAANHNGPYRMTTSDPNSSPSVHLHAFRQTTAPASSSNLIGNQPNRFSHTNSSGQMCNIKSSTHSGGLSNSGSAIGKMRLSPKNQPVGSSSFAFGQPYRNRKNQQLTQKKSHKDKMEIEGEDEPHRVSTVSIVEVLLNLIGFDKKREQATIDEDQPITLADLGKSVDDLKILDCPLDLRNQRTIKVDAERTRINDIKSVWESSGQKQGDTESVITTIESVLTFYTKNSNTTYKQGYNELLAPFLWLALQNQSQQAHIGTDVSSQNPLALSYHALQLFIKNFMPTLFLDDDFICLQSCFCLLRLLLKYHDPEICYVLSNAGVTPELYATSWFFTFFANKCEHLDVVCELWSRVIQDQDNKFIFPFSIALIMYNRDRIMSSQRSDLPERMSGLTIESIDQLTEIMQLAYDIRESTPVSFQESPEMDILFGENSQQFFRKMSREQKVHMHLRLEQMQCLPISIIEFFQNIYPDNIPCSNPKCFKFAQIQKSDMSQSSLLQTTFDDSSRGGPRGPGKAFSNSISSSGSIQGILLPPGVQKSLHSSHKLSSTNHASHQFSPTKQVHRDRGPTNIYSPQLLKRNDPDYLDPTGFNQVQFQQNGAKSPFKTLVKQQPIEADASVVPMETETNVKDDDSDNQPLQKMTNSFQVLQQDLDQKRKIRSDKKQKPEDGNMNQNPDQSANINHLTKIEDGPTFVQLCEGCRSSNTDLERQNPIRLVVMDCRISMLQKEAMLPSTAKFEINNNCDKKYLQQQVRNLIADCSEQDHICLVGLSEQEVPKDYNQAQEIGFGQSPMSRVGQSNDGSYDIKEYHERVLRCVIEIFYKERMKYISFLPGGFEECHRFIENQNLQIIQIKAQNQDGEYTQQNDESHVQFLQFIEPHDSNNCYHCTMMAQPQSPSSSNPTMDSSRTVQNVHLGGYQKSHFETSDEFQGSDKEFDHLPVHVNHRNSQRYARNPSELNARHAGAPSGEFSKYEQKRYNISGSSAVAQNEENMQNDKSEAAFDIFSGFRHWWQDNIVSNITSNQKLMGFGLSDLEASGAPQASGNGQVFYQDNNGQQFPLEDVTQQTRNNIKSKKMQQSQRENVFPTSQKVQRGGVPLQQNYYQNEQEQYIAKSQNNNKFYQQQDPNQSHTSHLINEVSAGSQYQPQAAQYQRNDSKDGHLNQMGRHANSQPDHQGFRRQVDSNQSSTKTINSNLTKFTQDQIHVRQNHQLHQQMAQSNRAMANRTATMSQSGFPGLVSRVPNKSPGRPMRIIESREDENLENKEVFNYQIDTSQHKIDHAQNQGNEISPILRGQSSGAVGAPVPKGMKDFNQSESDSVADPTHHHGSSESPGAKAKQQPQPAAFLSEQLGSNNEVKDAHTNQETPAESNFENRDGEAASPQEQKAAHQDQLQPDQEANSFLKIERIAKEKFDNQSKLANTLEQSPMSLPQNQSKSNSGNQASQQFQLEERSYYLCNGIQKQQSYYNYQHKVQRIVEVDALAAPNDIVIYHVKRLASSHLQQVIQQQQMIQWQQQHQADNNEVTVSQIFGHNSQNANVTSIIITQYTTICLCQSYSFIQSRFFMHDLIKITSRKSSAKIITFYFRIPQFGEYNQCYFSSLEQQSDPASQDNIILDTYNQNPIIPYQFAYRRKKYQEVKMGFEFKNEEEARDCIERVSILYKRLKGSKS